MAYPLIESRRISYDIDGTVVACGYNGVLNKVFTFYLNSEILTKLNTNEGNKNAFGDNQDYREFVFFFSEKKIIDYVSINLLRTNSNTALNGWYIEGSEDSTNGADGTWETATLPEGNPIYISYGFDSYRTNIKPISFVNPIKTLRIGIFCGWYANPINIHLYGYKAPGEMPNDIIFCDSIGNEFTKLIDWGDRIEGTSVVSEVYLKNTSLTKTANNINISINHTDFLISFDQINWSNLLNITSLTPAEISGPIYIKNTIHPQVLMPKGTPLIVNISSWI